MNDSTMRAEDLKTLYKNGLMTREEYIDLTNKDRRTAENNGIPYVPPVDTTTINTKNTAKKKRKSPFLIWILIAIIYGYFDEIKEFFAPFFDLFK